VFPRGSRPVLERRTRVPELYWSPRCSSPVGLKRHLLCYITKFARSFRDHSQLLERSALQSKQAETAGNSISGRRAMFAGLFAVSMGALIVLAAVALSPAGFSAIDIALIILFTITLPWMVAGFWNAMIGFLILRFSSDAIETVIPQAASIRGDEPIVASTAILLCIRNELPERMIRNLHPLLSGLDTSGFGDRFHVYILSDTSDAQIATVERERFAELANLWDGRIAMTYRRRAINTGFKAGNIRDFCEQWGTKHEFAVSLDADSFMTAEATLFLIRIMQADPELGILQGLVVGLPSTSAFARVFQFGMRLGMRSYTIGSAWWQGDCGPYWGHNAVFRLGPFVAHCELPVMSQDGTEARHILSHDQIEAALMRAAGYSVRVLPDEGLGWEENPPTLLEYIRRDLRWCQGNMQYWRFLTMPGLKPVSRYQLGLAILMFIGSPAWIGMLVLGTLALTRVETPADFMRIDAGIGLFVCVLVMWFSPKIASAIDILLRPKLQRELPVVSLPTSLSRQFTRSCCVRFFGSATPFFCLACCSVATLAGSVRRAMITPCLSRKPCKVCGRTRCSAVPRWDFWRRPSQPRFPTHYFSQGDLHCRSPSP